jgi:hypothetical protein
MSTTLHGWKPDPFGRYENRYFSDGTPTALVRSGRLETRDEPGDRPDEASPQDSRGTLVAPVAFRPRLYERRRRRVVSAIVLGAAIVVPLLAWELLVTTTSDRLFGIGAFAFVAGALAIAVRVLRAPSAPRRARAIGHPTPMR